MSVAGIIHMTATAFRVAPAAITGTAKYRICTRPRFAAAWVARQRGYSLSLIGKALRRDHSTIHSAIRRAEMMRNSDHLFRAATDGLLSGTIACCPHCGEVIS